MPAIRRPASGVSWFDVCDQKCTNSVQSADSPSLRLDLLAQNGVDGGLVALAALAEERQDIGVKANRDLLLRSGPANGLAKEVGPQLGNIGIIDFRVLHCIKQPPVSPGAPLRTPYTQLRSASGHVDQYGSKVGDMMLPGLSGCAGKQLTRPCGVTRSFTGSGHGVTVTRWRKRDVPPPPMGSPSNSSP